MSERHLLQLQLLLDFFEQRRVGALLELVQTEDLVSAEQGLLVVFLLGGLHFVHQFILSLRQGLCKVLLRGDGDVKNLRKRLHFRDFALKIIQLFEISLRKPRLGRVYAL